MPGTFQVQMDRTFSVLLLMGSGPKLRFQSQEQDVSAAGEKKWSVQAAATWQPEYGMRPVSEVIEVTMTGGANPAESIPVGSPVTFDAFRVGVSQAEARENGKGVRGGRPYYSAAGIRPAHAARKADAA